MTEIVGFANARLPGSELSIQAVEPALDGAGGELVERDLLEGFEVELAAVLLLHDRAGIHSAHGEPLIHPLSEPGCLGDGHLALVHLEALLGDPVGCLLLCLALPCRSTAIGHADLSSVASAARDLLDRAFAVSSTSLR